jgi:hypothetical protein
MHSGIVFVLIVRIVRHRPGKQLTPFELVLVYHIGGLMLKAIVGDEVSRRTKSPTPPENGISFRDGHFRGEMHLQGDAFRISS